MKTILHSIAALACAGILLAAGAPAAAQSQEFGETIDVITVEVPVQVLDDGEPVRGLTKEDFELYDGRDQQTITGFDVVDLEEYGGRELPVDQVPISGRRHFLLLFDMAFSDPASISRARETARELIEEELHASDLVSVATYTHQRGPQLVLGFTSDRKQIKLAIETLGLPQLVERHPDPLAFVLGEATQSLREGATSDTEGGAGAGGIAGGIADAEFAAQLGDTKIGYDRAQRGEAQGRVLAMTTAFEDLAKVLNDVQGRKYVVLLSEGFNADLILGTDNRERRAELDRSAATGQFWEIDSEERYGSTGAINAVEQMLEEFRRADATIQAVDIGGLRAGPDARGQAGGQDSLFMLADGTGGELYRNYNKLSGAMDEMLERTSVSYVLSFQAQDLEPDGGYHRLRVKLKDGPKGARLVHRPGFYAPRPYSEKSGMEKRLEAAEKIMSGRDGGAFTTSVVAAPFPGTGDKAYVPVLIEIDGPGILAGTREGVANLEIYAYAIAEDGSIGSYVTQTMGLDVKKVEPVLRKSGVKFFGDMDLPPGEYLLRVLVREGSTGRSSTSNVPITVPEFGGGKPSLAMPLFPEESGKWLVVQEASDQEEREKRPYPFVKHEEPFMPAARPVVTPGQATQFILVGYNLGDGAVPLRAECITAAGEPVSDAKISFVEQLARTTNRAHLMLQLDPAGIEPGEYRLVATLQNADGEDVSTSIPFVVPSGS